MIALSAAQRAFRIQVERNKKLVCPTNNVNTNAQPVMFHMRQNSQNEDASIRRSPSSLLAFLFDEYSSYHNTMYIVQYVTCLTPYSRFDSVPSGRLINAAQRSCAQSLFNAITSNIKNEVLHRFRFSFRCSCLW